MGKSKDIPFMFLENSNELKNNSFLINPTPYIKKNLVVGKLKRDKYAVLYYKQKEICPICSEDLISEFTHDTGIQTYKSNFLEDNSNPSLIHERISICYKPSVQNLNYDELDTLTEAKWYQSLDIDHIIPKRLSNQMKNIEGILRSNKNLRLVHHDCYNSKMNHDKKMYGIFKKNIKSEISHKVNLLDSDEKLE
jgi:hypothetical protein